MAKNYRSSELPQVTNSSKVFLTDAGLETVLLFLQGIDLPEFAAFPLLQHDTGTVVLQKYFEQFVCLAIENKMGFIFESATWRASKDWAAKLNIGTIQLAELVKKSIHIMDEIRQKYKSDDCPMVLSGNIGPRGDGYVVGNKTMTPVEAELYHTEQIDTFANHTNADLVSAVTMTYPEEAIGIVRAAQKLHIPSVIAFTVETDGRLPCGISLQDAIMKVDEATNNGPSYYMVNCAHVTHFEHIMRLNKDEPWVKRIRGLRSNASKKSHAELDQSDDLDDGDPEEFGQQNAELRQMFGDHLNIFGGCCGTDSRHITQITEAFQQLT